MRRKWTITELAELISRYPHAEARTLAADLCRSQDSITSKARGLRLRSREPHQRRAWNRATASATVNARFFDEANAATTWVLGVLWGCARIKTKHRCVLKISLPKHKQPLLDKVCSLLKSRHQIQASEDKRILEIGNRRLVTTLINRFGQLPSRDDPDPPLPRIAECHIAAFALGLNEASGDRFSQGVYWSTTPNVAEAIATFLIQNVGAHRPLSYIQGRKQCVSWTRSSDVTRLLAFLDQTAQSIQLCTDPELARAAIP